MVDVVEEGVQRAHALLDAALQQPPFGGRDDARDEVEGDQPLERVLGAVDGEGDAEPAEDALRFLLLALQVVLRLAGKPFGDAPIGRPDLAVRAQHLVERALRRDLEALNVHVWQTPSPGGRLENAAYLVTPEYAAQAAYGVSRRPKRKVGGSAVPNGRPRQTGSGPQRADRLLPLPGQSGGAGKRPRLWVGRLHLRHQHLVDDMDDAVRLIDVGDGDHGRIARLVDDDQLVAVQLARSACRRRLSPGSPCRPSPWLSSSGRRPTSCRPRRDK